MSKLDDSEKNRILDFLAELIENARRTLEISEASQKIKKLRAEMSADESKKGILQAKDTFSLSFITL